MRTRIIPEITTNKMSGIAVAVSLCLALAATPTFADSIKRISVDSGSMQFNVLHADYQAMSDDGRYVAFIASLANEPSYRHNVYLRDRTTGTTELVSVANDGNDSGIPGSFDINGDGRYIVFTGKKLDGSNGNIDAYVRDRLTGTTELVSVASDGRPGTENKSASQVSINTSGRYVAFLSDSADLVSDDTNGVADIFIRDRIAGITRRINVASDGTQANGNSISSYRAAVISANGRYVVFHSAASNLVPNDSNGVPDLFVRDLVNGITERVNLSYDGSQGSYGHNGERFDMSSDGRYVTFASRDNLVANDNNGQLDIFVRDLATGTTELISTAHDGSQADSISAYPGISANGRYVSFNSMATNLVTGGNPQGLATFLRDRITNITEMVDAPYDGTAANNFSFGNSTVSADGRYVVFPSSASNLVPGDSESNTSLDIFIRDRSKKPAYSMMLKSYTGF
ncbi:MAG: hypothetical protein GXP18_03620 [Gammaproteobacteria bacterium]|nr:hypothetical protein [Gammaproteobacteria bacterium]